MNKRLLRILHAYKCYYPDEGGIPTLIQLIAQGLNTKTQPAVLCTHPGWHRKNQIIDQVNVHRLAAPYQLCSLPVTPHYPFALWKLLPQFDILDYHFPMPWVDLCAAIYLPRRIKLVVHWHSEIIRQKKLAKLIAPLIHRCLQRADRIVVADETFISASSFLSAYQKKCVVIPFGIPIQDWQTLTSTEIEKIRQLRQMYSPFVLAVGRLVSYKGFSVLLKAMQTVNAPLILVGQGPLLEELRATAKQLNLADRIHFYGKTNHSDLKCLYHAASVFALPSITENEAFGIVQIEAMACQKPIVNTALNSAVPKVARDGKEAITVAPYSEDELAKALQTLLDQPGLAQKLGENGRQRASTKYGVDNFLANTWQMYDSCVCESKVEK